jgi:HD-like signal output (HDOD) protein
MKRILFVDDEANILDGLRRMLHSQRKEWKMVFASSGKEALKLAEEAPFDVIVTDMRMPGMSGDEVLRRFHDRHPQTVRFVLSGHAELEGVMRAVSIAHQFLSKPCDADTLRDTVTRALELKNLLDDERAQEIIGEMDALPSQPATYTAIVQALADPEVEIPVVSKIIESDLAMSAKLLQLVNSAFFGLRQNMAEISQATRFLGLNLIRDLALSVEVFRPPVDATNALTEFLARLQNRSMWIASVAGNMFQDKRQANEAFTAGMLHDIGVLVMATRLPDRFAEVLELSRQSERPLHVVERELYGVSHAEVGAYLLGVWGLPFSIIEAAAYHHHPSDLPQETFNVLTAVHVASALVEAKSDSSDELPGPCAQIDLSYLEALGVRERLGEWEALVGEQIEENRGAANG